MILLELRDTHVGQYEKYCPFVRLASGKCQAVVRKRPLFFSNMSAHLVNTTGHTRRSGDLLEAGRSEPMLEEEDMKALFFGQDVNKIEQLALTLRIRWPDLESIMVSRGSHGLMAIEQKEPDIAFICEDLTDMNMFSVIGEIRKFSDIPIVALTGEDEMQGVKVLDRGGDDYITPSTNMMVKVVAIMRRFNLTNRRIDEGPIYCGELVIDPATYEVYLGSTSLRLTPTEFRLLHLLARNRDITLLQNFIMDEIWSDDIDGSDKVKKYIQRLRRKLDDDAKNPRWIKTVHGMGYRLSPPVPEEELATANAA